MSEMLAYLNGECLPFADMRLSPADYGFVRGAIATEMIRTFGHQPFRVEQHLARLTRSLESIGLEPAPIIEEVSAAIESVTGHNVQQLPRGADLGVSVFVTPGMHPGYLTAHFTGDARPTVGVHTLSLATATWAPLYQSGVALVTPSVRQIPAECLSPRIKTRNRLHWHLADREVAKSHPAAMALLLDLQEHVTETSSGNLLAFDGQDLITPRLDAVLDGISQGFVLELAHDRGLSHREQDLSVDALATAEEVFISSTGFCLLPVTAVNGRQIGTGRPGPLYAKFIGAWSAAVGVDIIAQAREQSHTGTS